MLPAILTSTNLYLAHVFAHSFELLVGGTAQPGELFEFCVRAFKGVLEFDEDVISKNACEYFGLFSVLAQRHEVDSRQLCHHSTSHRLLRSSGLVLGRIQMQ